MKASPSKPLPAEPRAARSGKRYWFQITGLPGWKRVQLDMPAFGNANCSPPTESLSSDAKTVSAYNNQKDKS
jgi:hypothetical protein